MITDNVEGVLDGKRAFFLLSMSFYIFVYGKLKEGKTGKETWIINFWNLPCKCK